MQDAPTPRRALQLIVALASVVLSACKGGEGANARASVPAASSPEAKLMASAGPVVIAAPVASYTAGPVTVPSAVSGTVTLASPLAPREPMATGRDSALCGAAVPDSSLQQKGAGLGNVVVWLDGVRAGKVIPLEKRLELESDRCILTPRVQAAVIGSAVNVIGHDDFRQHLHFITAGERGPRASVLMGKDEQVIPTELPAKVPGLVIVRDADHPWPAAFVAVFDHPYYAVTRPDGSFTIAGVPAGRYTLAAWHERTGKSEQPVVVGANGTTAVTVVLTGK